MRCLGAMMHRVCLAVRGQADAVEGRAVEAEKVARRRLQGIQRSGMHTLRIEIGC